jgi:hypothetical protein
VAVLHQPGRILCNLAVANRESLDERKQCAVAIASGRTPFLLLKLALNVLGGDGLGWVLAEPSEQQFHAPCIAAIGCARLVGFRVGQRVAGNLDKRDGRPAQRLRELLASGVRRGDEGKVDT